MNFKQPTAITINDLIYGFIEIKDPIILQIIEEPCFQRLRRINQMGMSYLVFPGARHTRFEHALGSMHLMQKTINLLKSKRIDISAKEERSLLLAILLHDIGHGPYSHALESSLMGSSHEEISLKFIEKLHLKYGGDLDMAIEIFKGKHTRLFFNQLVSSQLDIDRLDYIVRDSFFCATPEGNTNVDRIISMLNVVDGELVIEEKGIYPVESFLIARRFMYWQVYFHKASLVAEQMLIRILKRSREVFSNLGDESISPALKYFIKNWVNSDDFQEEELAYFSQLDDYDVFWAIKYWQSSDDFILSELCKMLVNRNLLGIQICKTPISEAELEKTQKALLRNFSKQNAKIVPYFIFSGKLENTTYEIDAKNIKILSKSGRISDIEEMSDSLDLKSLSKPIVKYYLSYCRTLG